MKKVEIYSANNCPFCVKAKTLLNKKNVMFHEIDVSNDDTLREKMSNMTNGKRSVPQIFINNVYIGDCEKIYQLEKENKLNRLLGLD